MNFHVILLETTEFIGFLTYIESIRILTWGFLFWKIAVSWFLDLKGGCSLFFSNQGFKYCVSLAKLCLFRDLRKKTCAFRFTTPPSYWLLRTDDAKILGHVTCTRIPQGLIPECRITCSICVNNQVATLIIDHLGIHLINHSL